jgi:hypothetical protein
MRLVRHYDFLNLSFCIHMVRRVGFWHCIVFNILSRNIAGERDRNQHRRLRWVYFSSLWILFRKVYDKDGIDLKFGFVEIPFSFPEMFQKLNMTQIIPQDNHCLSKYTDILCCTSSGTVPWTCGRIRAVIPLSILPAVWTGSLSVLVFKPSYMIGALSRYRVKVKSVCSTVVDFHRLLSLAIQSCDSFRTI